MILNIFGVVEKDGAFSHDVLNKFVFCVMQHFSYVGIRNKFNLSRYN
jgi:hypothetical protein